MRKHRPRRRNRERATPAAAVGYWWRIATGMEAAMVRLAMAAAVLVGLASAEGSAVAQGQGAAYCLAYRNALQQDARNLEQISSLCRSGDILPIPDDMVAAIGKFCDFTRNVVHAGRTVFCTYGANRPTR
jgi:hypothetical protein